MKSVSTCLALLLLSGATLRPAAAQEAKEEKADGYLEWRQGMVLIADGQRVRTTPATKYKGKIKDIESIPLGFELKARGVRDAEGMLVATEIEAKNNGQAMFESDVLSATNNAEAQSVKLGRFLEGGGARSTSMGRLVNEGPEVDRARFIVEALCPPYLDPGGVRVYVIENREWNAFAMGNYSIYVFTGLLNDLDDDELAIVLGHELVHATHEHTRRQFKKQMWIQLAALGLAGVEEATIDDGKKKAVLQLATVFAASAVSSGYGRDLEDQADRVGMRYAYEAGYDITKGPRLWNRFAKKYGEQGKAANFFFGDHSLSSARAIKLERQLAYNYPEGAKVGVAKVRRPSAAASTTVASAPSRSPAGASGPGTGQALASTAPASAAAPQSAEIKPGMTTTEVEKLLGTPREQVTFGNQTKWVYPSLSIIFQAGKVKEVRF